MVRQLSVFLPINLGSITWGYGYFFRRNGYNHFFGNRKVILAFIHGNCNLSGSCIFYGYSSVCAYCGNIFVITCKMNTGLCIFCICCNFEHWISVSYFISKLRHHKAMINLFNSYGNFFLIFSIVRALCKGNC